MLKFLKVKYHHQLIEMMLKTTFVGTLSVNILVPFFFALLLYKNIPTLLVIIWLVSNIFLFIVRLVVGKKATEANNKKDGTVHHYIYLIMMIFIITASLHAYALWYSSFVISEVQLFFMQSITVTLISGSIATISSVFSVYFVFVVFNVLPILFVSIYHGGELFYTFAVAVAAYTFAMLNSGYVHYKSLKENIELKESFEQRVNESILELEAKNARINESLKSFQDLQETSMVMVAFIDEDNKIIDMNLSALQTFGYDNKEEAIGLSVAKFIQKESLHIAIDALTHEVSAPYELMLQKRDGTIFPALLSGRYTTLDTQRVRITTMMDLSEIKAKEKLLYKQSKLAQMGEMMSMIAHQWRQPLSAISSTSTSINLKSKLGTLDKAFIEENTDNISSYSQHLSETIDDFRNFFKPNKEKSITSFPLLVDSVLKIMGNSLKNHGVEIILDVQSETEFQTYANEIKQVILNLVQNAEDALLENSVERAFIKVVTREEASAIVLEVHDNAGGLNKAIIEEIFNPYFSTKKQKDGMGLGLYMSKIIIEEHCGGKLRVANTKEGAMFSISLQKDSVL